MSVVVLDIGKTKVRVAVVGPGGEAVAIHSRANRVAAPPPFPHFDVEGLFGWLMDSLRDLARGHAIEAIVPVTHGACAALLANRELALPVLDYEFEGPEDSPGYDEEAACFEETGTPRLPAGLNLGRQLHWQAQAFPEAFARVDTLLPWPQYWAFRLSGVAAFEPTSLGCHTDLWSPRADAPSRYAVLHGLDRLLPGRVHAWSRIGPVSRAVGEKTGLSSSCQVVAGIHDSNASFFTHRAARSEPFAVVSTGTWFVVMAHAGEDVDLRGDRDTLLNVDAFADPLPTARFPGGREIVAIRAGDTQESAAELPDVTALIRAGAMVLPAFSELGGPFRTLAGAILGVESPDPRQRAALAALYSALMTDLCLDAVGARGDVIVEGRFARDEAYCLSLALLRPSQALLLSGDETGTLAGGALLAGWPELGPSPTLKPLQIAGLEGELLRGHRTRWRRRVAAFPTPSKVGKDRTLPAK